MQWLHECGDCGCEYYDNEIGDITYCPKCYPKHYPVTSCDKDIISVNKDNNKIRRIDYIRDNIGNSFASAMTDDEFAIFLLEYEKENGNNYVSQETLSNWLQEYIDVPD